MAPPINVVNSQAFINASQDAVSSPAGSAVQRTPPPITQKSQTTKAISRNSSNESTQIVKESLEDIPEDNPPRQQSSASTQVRSRATQPLAVDDNDLYDATPRASKRTQSSKQSERASPAAQNQHIADKFATNVKTQRAGATTISTRIIGSGPSLSQLFADVVDVSADEGAAKATTKFRLLTQTSKSDEIEPATGTLIDPPASIPSRKNRHDSSTKSAPSRNLSGTSQTSVMASAAKSAAATLKQSKSQPAATGTNAKAKFEALKAARAGNSASTTLPATKVVLTNESVSKVTPSQHAGAWDRAKVRETTGKPSIIPTEHLIHEMATRSGKLPTLRKSMPIAAASSSKKAVADANFRLEERTEKAVQHPVGTAAKSDKKRKLEAIVGQKLKGGPFVGDDDYIDTSERGGPSRGLGIEDEYQSAHNAPQQRAPAGTRKRKADNHDGNNLDDDAGTATTMAVTRNRHGALPAAPMNTKCQRQAPSSSAPDEEEREQDQDDDSEYGPPKLPAKTLSKDTKKAKAASKNKAAPMRKTLRPTRVTRQQAAVSEKAKAAGNIPNAAEAHQATTSRTNKGAIAQDLCKHVVEQKQKQEEAFMTTVETPTMRIGLIPLAVDSKAEGKQPVDCARHDGNGTSVEARSDLRQESNLLGQTQEDAIVLSDNEDRSSSLTASPTPEKKTVTTKHAPAASKTPARARQSSLPRPEDDENRQLAQLQRTMRAHKPTFINFDKSGPRNQGVAAVKTPSARSVGKTPVAPPSPRPKRDLKGKGGPSSFATSGRSGKPMQRALSSNIASSVDDALSNLLKKQEQGQLPLHMSPDPDDGAAIQRISQSNADANDGFMNNDDYDDVDDTLVQMNSPPNLAADQMPVEGKVRPAPANGSAMKLNANLSIPRHERPLLKHTVDVPERCRDLPASGQPAAPTCSPHKHRKPAPAMTQDSIMNAREDRVDLLEKRSYPGGYDHEPLTKRVKLGVRGGENADPPTTITKAHQVSPMQEVAASSTPQGKRVMVMTPPVVPAKPLRPSTKTVAPPAEDCTAEPARCVKGQPSWHISHGSQTVDVYGSPVPAKMVVHNPTTVLETFSHQTGVVSDQDAVERTLKRQRTKFAAKTQQPDNDLRYSVPQSHQPEPLSSNTKPVPAAPQAASNVLPRLELSQLRSETPLGKRDALAEMLDPFASSNGTLTTRESEVSVQVQGGLAEQFDAKMKRLEEDSISEENESEEKFVHTEPQKWKKKAGQSPSPISHSIQDEAEMSDHDMERLRAIASLTHRCHEEDADKTLVNEDDDYSDDNNEDEFQDYVRDARPQDSKIRAGNFESSDPASDDLMSWRKTLRPHQLNLFQELIRTSRRLTEYFVEQENTVLRNVEKAHRQKIYAIEQEEIARAKLYSAKKEELKRKKKDIKKDLKKAQRSLTERLEQRKKEKEERRVKRAKWEEENENLEALISKLS